MPSSSVKFHCKYLLFYFCWNLLLKRHLPSPLSRIIFAVQFVDCECPCAPLCSPLHSFLRELKGQIFYTKSLIFLLILVGCFLWDFSVMYVPVTRKVEFQCLIFHIPYPNHEQLSLTIGAHHWVVIWCSLRLLSCSPFPGSICTGLELLGSWDATTAQGKGFLMELLMPIIP